LVHAFHPYHDEKIARMPANRTRLLKMRRILFIMSTCLLAGTPAALSAQLVPSLPPVIDRLPDTLGRTVSGTLDRVEAPVRATQRLLDDRVARLRGVVSANRRVLELDADGDPAVRGELMMLDASADTLGKASAAGFAVIGEERIDGLDIGYTRLAIPKGMTLARAEKRLREIAGPAEISADQLHFQSGKTAPLRVLAAAAQAAEARAGTSIGMIDGGVARHPALGGPIEQRGFAGAPIASNHGTAVASLMVGQGTMRSPAPGTRLFVADVYGGNPAGGSAAAIARALGWLVGQRVPVVTISLVGPRNPLLDRVVRAAQARGTMIVAAVGNDGPAAPPAYPASYDGVIAVTGIDARNRALIEAGRALHLDFAAPGADMRAADGRGGLVVVRGTSFAAPLVAASLLAHYPSPDPAQRDTAYRALAQAAVDLGAKGPDKQFGQGLVCGDCRTR